MCKKSEEMNWSDMISKEMWSKELIWYAYDTNV